MSEMVSNVYGYARVSTKDQNLARQYDAFGEFGIAGENVFADKKSGKNFDRPAYKELKGMLRPGDVFVVKSIDRMGRNYDEIVREWKTITKDLGADIVVLDMPLLDTRSSETNTIGVLIADIVLELMSYVAEVERENMLQRQQEGYAAAKARGVRFGRPKKPRPKNYTRMKKAYLEGKIPRTEAAKACGVCVATFTNWLVQDDAIVVKKYKTRKTMTPEERAEADAKREAREKRAAERAKKRASKGKGSSKRGGRGKSKTRVA